MSKKFGFIGVVASIMFAYSFLVAAQVQADLVSFGPIPEEYEAVYVDEANFGPKWSWGGVSPENDGNLGYMVKFSYEGTLDSFEDFWNTVEISYMGSNGRTTVSPPDFSSPGGTVNDQNLVEYIIYGLWESQDQGDVSDIRFTFNPSLLAGVDVDWYTLTESSETPPGDTPEPATLAVFGLGLLGTGLIVNRRRNRK